MRGLWISGIIAPMNQTLTKGRLGAPSSRTPRTAERYKRALKGARELAKKHRADWTAEEQEQQAHKWAGQWLEGLARHRGWITQENPLDRTRVRMTDLATTLAKLRKSAVARGASGKELKELGHANELLRRMRRDYEEILREAIAQAHADAAMRAAGNYPREASEEPAAQPEEGAIAGRP